MSIKCMNWAWGVDLQPAIKLVLLKLSDRANDDGECWPGQDTIAASCNMSERSVMRHIAALAGLGIICVDRRKSENGRQATNLYRLQFDWKPGDKLSPGDVDDRVTVVSPGDGSFHVTTLSPGKDASPGDSQGENRVTTVSLVLKEEPPIEPSVRARARVREVTLDKPAGRFWVDDPLYDRWIETYRRLVDPEHWSKVAAEGWLETEIAKAANYVLDPQHPKRPGQYRDWKKFLCGWFDRSLRPPTKTARFKTNSRADKPRVLSRH